MSNKLDINVTLTLDTLILEYPEERNIYRTNDACDVIEKYFHEALRWEQLHADDTHTLHEFTAWQHLQYLVEENAFEELIHICDIIEEKGMFHRQEKITP